MLMIILFISPLIATLTSLIFRVNFKIVEILTITSVIIQFIVSIFIVNTVIASGSYTVTPYFQTDSLSALLIMITSVTGMASVFYNIGYTRQEMVKKIIGPTRAKQSYLLINLFLLAMFLAITGINPVITWISIEATTLSTVFLISFYNRPSTVEAAWKYMLINSVGLMLAFLGTVIYLALATPYLNGAQATWQNILSIAPQLNPAAVKIAFVFILIGYGTKFGIAPMHTWRPDAYSKAPIPVVALLSGALLNIALLPILRFKLITDASLEISFTQNLFIFFGVLSIIIAAFAIFKQENYKRLLAYSSVEHAGIILLGFGFGGLGIYAGLLQMIYHALAKSAMFLLSGNIFLKYSSPKINKTFGIIQTLPKTGVLFVIGFLALAGIPPFGLFMSEFYIFVSGIQNYLWVIVLVIFALAIIFFGFFKIISSMMFGKIPDGIKIGEFGSWTILPPAMLLLILMILSVFIPSNLQVLLNNTVILFK